MDEAMKWPDARRKAHQMSVYATLEGESAEYGEAAEHPERGWRECVSEYGYFRHF